MLDSNDHKYPSHLPRSKYFFKCVDELPVNAYKKIKVESRRKGILRCDWFNKILDRVLIGFIAVSHDDIHGVQLLRGAG